MQVEEAESPRGEVLIDGSEVNSFASSDLRMMTLGEGHSAANNVEENSAAKKSLASE